MIGDVYFFLIKSIPFDHTISATLIKSREFKKTINPLILNPNLQIPNYILPDKLLSRYLFNLPPSRPHPTPTLMPPKINQTLRSAHKSIILNHSVASSSKLFSYNEDMELAQLKKYIDARSTPKIRSTNQFKTSTKSHRPKVSHFITPISDPIQEDEGEQEDDNQSEFQVRQKISDPSSVRPKNRKPKVLNPKKNKKKGNQDQNKNKSKESKASKASKVSKQSNERNQPNEPQMQTRSKSKEIKKQPKLQNDSKEPRLSKQSKKSKESKEISKQKKGSKQSKQPPNIKKNEKQQTNPSKLKPPITEVKEPPKKRTYAEELVHLIKGRRNGTIPSYIPTKEQSRKGLELYMKIKNQIGTDVDVPPYYTRMTLRDSEQSLKLIKKKQEIAEKVFKEDKISPVLFPQPGNLTERMRKNIISSVDIYERPEKPKERDFSKMYKKIPPKDRENMEESAYLNEIPELEDESSKYITEKVIVKLRHKDDLHEYYEQGFKRLYEDIPRGPPVQAFSSPEKLNKAIFMSFTTADNNYYISHDDRNFKFSGYPQTDEPYIKDMPFDLLFPQLATEMFGFPQRPNDSFAEDDDDFVIDKDLQPQPPNPYQDEQPMTQQQLYRCYHDPSPMPKEDIDFIRSYIMKELEEYKQKNKQTSFFNKYAGKWTNRWDYYCGSQRFDPSESQQARSFLDESLNYSRTQTMVLPVDSKTKTVRTRSKGIDRGSRGWKDKNAKRGESQVKDKKYETKTKLREMSDKEGYNEITDSEGDWEDDN